MAGSSLLTEAIRKAFKVAQVEKPGPTHLDLPEDVARMGIEDSPLSVNRPRGGVPAGREIERALDVIQGPRSPIIIAGNGVVSYQNPPSLMVVGLQAEESLYCTPNLMLQVNLIIYKWRSRSYKDKRK